MVFCSLFLILFLRSVLQSPCFSLFHVLFLPSANIFFFDFAYLQALTINVTPISSGSSCDCAFVVSFELRFGDDG